MLPSITHEDDHFAKYCIKIGWKKKHVKIWNQKQKRLHNNSIHFSERGF
jgi:hypothetical protein